MRLSQRHSLQAVHELSPPCAVCRAVLEYTTAT
jgi:hypothetical protein